MTPELFFFRRETLTGQRFREERSFVSLMGSALYQVPTSLTLVWLLQISLSQRVNEDKVFYSTMHTLKTLKSKLSSKQKLD